MSSELLKQVGPEEAGFPSVNPAPSVAEACSAWVWRALCNVNVQ